MTNDEWFEYDKVAEWCARNGYSGGYGEILPIYISPKVCQEIRIYNDEFKIRVSDMAYALHMNKLNLPEE